MITIITGVPGMGKTALMVAMLLQEAKKGDRPLFVMGVDNLQIDHQPLPKIEDWTYSKPDKDDPSVELHYFTFPPNSILIVDEAQKIYRPRASSAKVPPIVSALETHRHTGIDIWLLTQKPSLLDQNVRDLCGRHIHIRNSILGRKIYEWPEYRAITETNLKDASSRFFKPPKQAFALYKSAELHTKQKFRIHNAFIVLAIMIPILIYLFYSLYTKFNTKINQTDKPMIGTLARVNEPQNKDLIDTSFLPSSQIQSIQQNDVITETKHPFIGFNFTIKGTLKSKRLNSTYYEITNGQKSLFITDRDLKNLGYEITQMNDCSSFLYFQGAQIVATCENEAAQSARSAPQSRVIEQMGVSGGTPDVDALSVPPNTTGLHTRSSPSNSPST